MRICVTPVITITKINMAIPFETSYISKFIFVTDVDDKLPVSMISKCDVHY